MKDFAKKYLDIIETNFSGLNLTRINNFDDFYQKQVLDSIIPFQNKDLIEEQFKDIEKQIIVDVGFGGGFPILPLRNLLDSQIKLVGIDARKKKVLAVESISNLLNFKNIYFNHNRIENINFDKNSIILFKAVGKIEEFLSKINFTSEVKVYFYKGPNLNELEPGWEAVDGWLKICDFTYSYDDTKRRLVGFKPIVKRSSNTQKKVVNLSDIILL